MKTIDYCLNALGYKLTKDFYDVINEMAFVVDLETVQLYLRDLIER